MNESMRRFEESSPKPDQERIRAVEHPDHHDKHEAIMNKIMKLEIRVLNLEMMMRQCRCFYPQKHHTSSDSRQRHHGEHHGGQSPSSSSSRSFHQQREYSPQKHVVSSNDYHQKPNRAPTNYQRDYYDEAEEIHFSDSQDSLGGQLDEELNDHEALGFKWKTTTSKTTKKPKKLAKRAAKSEEYDDIIDIDSIEPNKHSNQRKLSSRDGMKDLRRRHRRRRKTTTTTESPTSHDCDSIEREHTTVQIHHGSHDKDDDNHGKQDDHSKHER